MNKFNLFVFSSFITFSLVSTKLFGQKQNFYLFLEPNISILYDSNYFRVTKQFSNTLFGTEACDMSYYGDKERKVSINIKADYPVKYLPKRVSDSLILAGLEEIRKIQNDSFDILNIDKDIMDIYGFSCVGFVGYNKLSKRYLSIINCYHFSDSDKTEITLMSNGSDLKADYKVLLTLLDGFKSYSKKVIEEEELFIRNKYRVIVTSSKENIDEFRYRPKTYFGFVSVEQKLEHKIYEVRLMGDFASESFAPWNEGQVPILSLDEEKGEIFKKGELILLNSFGKKVKIPFHFTYKNSGLW